MEKEQLLQEITSNLGVIRRLMTSCMQQMKPKLPMSQVELLFLVQQNNGINLKELAKSMQITPGAVTQIAENLERAEYIMRKQSPQDRRVALIYITPKGQELFENLHKQKSDLFTRVYATLTAEELQLVDKIQKKMIENLKNSERQQ